MEIACFLIPIVRKGLGLGPPPDSRLRENDTILSPQHRNVTPAQERHPSAGTSPQRRLGLGLVSTHSK